MADKPPNQSVLTKFASWRPPAGVVSIYLRTDPADRRQGWRTELRDGLHSLIEGGAGEGADHRAALRAVAERVTGRFPDARQPEGRCQVGFVEVAEHPGQDFWRSLQVAPPGTSIVHRERAYLRPLLELLDDGAPVGILTVSAERIQLFEWGLGVFEEIHDWEPSFAKGTWKERRAPRMRDAARGQATSASGKDQVDQRLEANRERFQQQAGREVRVFLDDRGWRALIAFGDPALVAEVGDGLGHRPELRHGGEENLVHAERRELAGKVEAAVAELNRQRERELVRQATDAALSANGRGALGLTEIQRALDDGRVAHLVFAAERPVDVTSPTDPNRVGDRPATIGDELVRERMIEQALLTSAAVTPVEGEAASELAEHGGVAALLRY